MDGALLLDKHAGVSSFGVIDLLKKSGIREKMGHGGTLDPFATGLLIVCAGRGVKLSRYFLGSVKSYEATLLFGQTTVPGDPTSEVSERSETLPDGLSQIREMAARLTAQPYLQTPPMYSAKKKDGRPLYELARQGIEIEREARLCRIYRLDFHSYSEREARFSVCCSSGTYIRTLAQDFARLLGSVGMLQNLRRVGSGCFSVGQAMSAEGIARAMAGGTKPEELPCFVPFDELLRGYPRAEATLEEAQSLIQGRQAALVSILQRARGPESPAERHEDGTQGGYEDAEKTVAIYSEERLMAVARNENGAWGLERVFT